MVTVGGSTVRHFSQGADFQLSLVGRMDGDPLGSLITVIDDIRCYTQSSVRNFRDFHHKKEKEGEGEKEGMTEVMRKTGRKRRRKKMVTSRQEGGSGKRGRS